MRLLLTSAGIKNDRIKQTLLELLGKPIEECTALCIPTAIYALPGGTNHAWNFFNGDFSTPMCEVGWKSVGVLELSALPSLDETVWRPAFDEADVLLVNGGDPLFLHYWMKQSGVSQLLPDWNGVYVGLSAGSMVMTPRIGEAFVGWQAPGVQSDETLGYVDFSIFPHLDHEMLPENTSEHATEWAGMLAGPSYAIDDETAIRVVDGRVDVISEGNWLKF
ncbi:Type 1 glutamine amidotransferase-like domain-containing protein [Exiguobacterium mexicanum]|uniref:Type 1 glutamine amidotransferase-like domain-containing protein n=1 Tax=Exiguobacterium mexicanum TaxID=340146 RepID=A0ABT7MRV4_9BACL|nr:MULTISPECIES: Type 1 glutamine amidotransferase-like domain-containing protein [Exiguobacterium]MDL5377880.1 Type 1 glutamine amidotransferase-like domain-containing protein [Exiguobacterium mexicanum]